MLASKRVLIVSVGPLMFSPAAVSLGSTSALVFLLGARISFSYCVVLSQYCFHSELPDSDFHLLWNNNVFTTIYLLLWLFLKLKRA